MPDRLDQLRSEAAAYERKYKAAKEQGKPLPKPDPDVPVKTASLKATAQPTTKPTYAAVDPKADATAPTRRTRTGE